MRRSFPKVRPHTSITQRPGCNVNKTRSSGIAVPVKAGHWHSGQHMLPVQPSLHRGHYIGTACTLQADRDCIQCIEFKNVMVIAIFQRGAGAHEAGCAADCYCR